MPPVPVPVHPPHDLHALAQQIVKRRFHFVKHEHPCLKHLFLLAVNEQTLKFVNNLESPARYDTTRRAYNLRRPLPVSKDRLLSGSNKIGTLPAIFHKMMEIINNPYASADDTAAIISTDPALSARLLRLVNSSFYGLSTRVDTISRAVSIVGHSSLMMLTMGTILASSFTGVPASVVDMRSFWMHAFSTGVMAQILAGHANLKNTENHFISGLLHDIARLLIFVEAPACAVYIVTESRQNFISPYEMEKDILGITHTELATELLERWNCPESIITPIASHHQPLDATAKPENIVLPLANAVSIALGNGTSGDFFVPDFNDHVWERMRLTPDNLTTMTKNLAVTISKMLFTIQPAE